VIFYEASVQGRIDFIVMFHDMTQCTHVAIQQAKDTNTSYYQSLELTRWNHVYDD